MTGPKGRAWGDLEEIMGKALHLERGWALLQASQGSGHDTKDARV